MSYRTAHTVQELINVLQQFPKDMKIIFEPNLNNRDTELSGFIAGDILDGLLKPIIAIELSPYREEFKYTDGRDGIECGFIGTDTIINGSDEKVVCLTWEYYKYCSAV